jgi:hypothetical protein
MARSLLALALTATVLAQHAAAQDPAAAPPDPLPGLPRPPDAPFSLLAPPVVPDHGPPLPGPYFEPDPRLDPEPNPPPGCFTDLEVQILDPHVKNNLSMPVTLLGRTVTVSAPSAPLDWTVAPEMALGYRLPSGFGELLVRYRYLGSSGDGVYQGPDSPADVQSRLEMHTLDIDYASREWSLWNCCWDMRWFFGARVTSVYFDSHSTESFAAAAAGSGIFREEVSNKFVGVGPHLGLELDKRFDGSGLAIYARADGWVSLGRINQAFTADSTTLAIGEAREHRSQAVPEENAQIGVRWEPPGWHHTYLYAGYQYEFWWNVGRDSETTSRGTVDDQGVFVRVEVNF